MFEFLDDAEPTQALPAGHDAIQFIRQWAFSASRSGMLASFEDLPPSQAKIAERIVSEIESREGKSVTKIPKAKIEKYIKVLVKRLQTLSRKQFHTGKIDGKTLLGKLRSAR